MSRPLKYTVEQVKEVIDKYFRETPKNEQTVTGLALIFGSKQLLIDYENRSEYTDIIRNAKLRIENIYEQALRSQYTTGAIFALKNFGWKDKIETEHSGEVKTSGIDFSKLSNEALREIADAAST